MLCEAMFANESGDLCQACYLFIADKIWSGYRLIFHFIFLLVRIGPNWEASDRAHINIAMPRVVVHAAKSNVIITSKGERKGTLGFTWKHNRCKERENITLK
jgi:hypothetical protein